MIEEAAEVPTKEKNSPRPRIKEIGCGHDGHEELKEQSGDQIHAECG